MTAGEDEALLEFLRALGQEHARAVGAADGAELVDDDQCPDCGAWIPLAEWYEHRSEHEADDQR